MSGAVILNWVLGAIIFVLIVGGGVYAIVRHGKAGPDHREARQSLPGQGRPQCDALWGSTCPPNGWPPRMAWPNPGVAPRPGRDPE